MSPTWGGLVALVLSLGNGDYSLCRPIAWLLYTSMPWDVLSGEVAKLKIGRREVIVLPRSPK